MFKPKVKSNSTTEQIKVNNTKENTMTKKENNDATFNAMNENKIEKSDRNNELLAKALKRAQKGDFDEDINDATNKDFLKVYERFTIREQFSIKEGKTFFQMYKEVFYIQDPHKYYFDTVEPTVYRRIAKQSENGDAEWAEAVAKEMNITIIKKA